MKLSDLNIGNKTEKKFVIKRPCDLELHESLSTLKFRLKEKITVETTETNDLIISTDKNKGIPKIEIPAFKAWLKRNCQAV